MTSVHRGAGLLLLTAIAVAGVATALVAAGAVNHRFPPWLPPASEVTETFAAPEEDIYRPLQAELDALEGLPPGGKALAGAGGVLAALAALSVMAAGAKLSTRQAYLLVTDDELGVATVAWSSVTGLAEASAMANPQVMEAKCRLQPKRRTPPGGPDRITVHCNPLLRTNASFPEVRTDLEQRIRQTIEGGTGVAVDRVNVTGTQFSRLPNNEMMPEPRTKGAQG